MKSYNQFYLGEIFENKKKEYKELNTISSLSNVSGLEEIVCCPLCKQNSYIMVGKFSISALIDSWVTRLNFNPIPIIYKNKYLEKRRCENCGLFYYNYHLHDSSELYEKISDSFNYYPQFRNEYGIATEYIQKYKPKSLLEIGSGNGSFLKRIEHIVPDLFGSEYNPTAATYCREQGFKIYDEDLSNIKKQFDMICHFEVLEHVFETNEFILQTVKLLKKGGKLLIGTPDPEGILAINGNGIFNLPPHHQFDFSNQSFEWIAKKFGLKIVAYHKEELQWRHYAYYIKNLTGMELTQVDISGYYDTQKKYSGHTHVVVFEKIK